MWPVVTSGNCSQAAGFCSSQSCDQQGSPGGHVIWCMLSTLPAALLLNPFTLISNSNASSVADTQSDLTPLPSVLPCQLNYPSTPCV